jgi:small subunit ribosomal protein S8
MTMTDPIADMLTRIRNANMSFKSDVSIPLSKVKVAIAKILEKEGYVSNIDLSKDNEIILGLKYDEKRQRTISGIKRISKPGLRVYVSSTTIPRVLGGMGIGIISTNKGLLTDGEARKQGVGGEIICEVW